MSAPTTDLAREAALLSAASGAVRIWLGLAADSRVVQFWLREPVAHAHAGLRLVEYVCAPAAEQLTPEDFQFPHGAPVSAPTATEQQSGKAGAANADARPGYCRTCGNLDVCTAACEAEKARAAPNAVGLPAVAWAFEWDNNYGNGEPHWKFDVGLTDPRASHPAVPTLPGYFRNIRPLVYGDAARPAAADAAGQAQPCKVCNGTRCDYRVPIGDPPNECEACFDQSPAEGQSRPTDLSKRLRETSRHTGETIGHLLLDATDEIERYYGGMLNWKATAQAQHRAPATSAAAVPAGYVLMPERLTAENGAKGALSGEFKECTTVTCHECGGSGEDSDGTEVCQECEGDGTVEQNVAVTWDTIKDIYRKAVEVCALRPAANGAEGQKP